MTASPIIRDLIEARQAATDENTKKLFRRAIQEIERLEVRNREAVTLLRATARALQGDD